jgi:hypothetical protein
MKAWAGGGQLSVARPPPATLLARRRRKTGSEYYPVYKPNQKETK